MDKIINCIIINGPNINMLGVREPELYSNKTLKEIEKNLYKLSQELSIHIETFQSNSEGKLVDFIQDNYQQADGFIINPAALSCYGYSMLEALIATKVPFIEVHLSNIYARERWHSDSIFSSKAVAVMAGMKDYIYESGVRAMCHYISENNRKTEE